MPGRYGWTAHLPCSSRNVHVSPSLSILKLGSIIPSATCSSRHLFIRPSKSSESPVHSRHTSSGSKRIEFPIPLQQAEHPSQSWQCALTISFADINFPSYNSLISILRFIQRSHFLSPVSRIQIPGLA